MPAREPVRTPRRDEPTRRPRYLGRHRDLLSDEKVRSWYDERCLRSRLSADVYLRQLGLLLESIGSGPDDVVRLARDDPDRLRDVLVRYSAKMKHSGRLDSYILKSFDGLRSFLEHRRTRFEDFPKLSPIRGVSLRNERVPSPDEFGRVLERLSLRGRVIALLMGHSGLRPGVIGSYGGESGLRLSDLPELKLGRNPQFTEIPFVVRVPAELSKTRAEYTTFGTQQLATSILAYLDSRRERKEKLTPASAVVAAGEVRGAALSSRGSARFGHGFLTTKAIVFELRQAFQLSAPTGVSWRPYVARSYCSTRLLLAEGNGKISRDLREAILGHDTGVAGRYHVGKRWAEELLVEARREYANAAEFLETNAQSRVNVASELRRTLLAVAGMSEEETAQHVDDSNEELLAILRQKLTGRDAAVSAPANGNGHGTQKPFTLEEAEGLLAQGWTYIANFGPNRVLLQGPPNR